MAAVATDVQRDARRDLSERLGELIGRLAREAESRVMKRDLIEQRWLEDLRQFHGRYEEAVEQALDSADKSRVFVNVTRQKTNACEARLADMLFPTDDRNWSISPTPVPELAVDAEEAAELISSTSRLAAAHPEDENAQGLAAQARRVHLKLQARLDEARRRARKMEEEIADHLIECQYQIQCRDVIRDACRLGTGILKGPMVGGRARPRWQRGDDGTFQLKVVEDKKPAFWRVDPWNFFPDMDARSIEDCEGLFERHLMNRKQLRRLRHLEGFREAAVLALLQQDPQEPTPTYISHLRSITGAYHDSAMNRFHVWEYQGPITAEEVRTAAEALNDEKLLEDAGLDPSSDEYDPLAEIYATVWFCQGLLLKFGLHPLDSADPLYSVFCLEKDEAGIFGFGVPYMMRDSQRVLNMGWRAMLDNAGLSAGPQIVINDDVIVPADGDYTLRARKVWRRKKTADPRDKPFEVFNIQSNQADLANIIELAKQFIDEETAVTQIAQGEQGTHTTQTAHGMSLLMNATNVVFRRIVKNFDDDLTTPTLRRLYHWLMQFSNKDYIKGDFDVDARGTSVLLVKEMQTANLMSFLLQFGGHPIFGKFLREEGVQGLRRLAQTMLVPADELVKTDEEIEADMAEAAAQPPPPDPEILKIEARLNEVQLKLESMERLALMNRETELMKLASNMNTDKDRIATELQKTREQIESQERIFAGEAALEERKAARGDNSGSGGYIS